MQCSGDGKCTWVESGEKTAEKPSKTSVRPRLGSTSLECGTVSATELGPVGTRQGSPAPACACLGFRRGSLGGIGRVVALQRSRSSMGRMRRNTLRRSSGGGGGGGTEAGGASAAWSSSNRRAREEGLGVAGGLARRGGFRRTVVGGGGEAGSIASQPKIEKPRRQRQRGISFHFIHSHFFLEEKERRFFFRIPIATRPTRCCCVRAMENQAGRPGPALPLS